MRLRRIGVQSVLNHATFELDFGEGDAGLHILHGPNEAGKSTLLRLLVDLLFGIQSGDGMPEYYDSRSRIEGTLGHTGEPPFHIQRRKNRNRLVLDAGSNFTEEELLSSYLGGYDKDRFTLLFGFDHQRLRVGGNSLLQSGGHAGVSLFEAGGGIQYLQNLLGRLSDRSGQLLDSNFRANASKELNKAWRAYQNAETTVRTSSLRGEEWHRQRDAIRRLEQSIKQIRDQLQGKQRDQTRMQRMIRVRCMLGELQDIRQRLMDMGEVVVLAAQSDQRIPEILDTKRNLSKELAERESGRDRQIGQLGQIQRDGDALENAEEINALNEGLQQYVTRKGEELLNAAEQLRQRQGDALYMLKSIAPGVSLNDAEQLRIPFADQERIEQLAEDLRQVRATFHVEQTRHDETVEEMKCLQQELNEFADLPDISALRRIIQEIRDQGDLEETIAQRTREIEQRRQELLRLVSGQRVWTGLLEQADTLPVPLRETIDQVVTDWSGIHQELRDCDRKLEDARGNLAAVIRELENLELSGRVPVEGDLSAVRTRRNSGWKLVKRAWLDEESNLDAVQAFSGDVPLHEAFESAIHEADETADWMRREANQSAQRALLLVRQVQIGRDIDALEEKRDALAAQFNILSAAWQEEWASSGIEPKTPVEMKDWYTNIYRPLVEGLRSVRTLEEALAGLTQKHDSFAIELVQTCTDLSIQLPENVGLKVLIQHCDSFVEGIAEKGTERRNLVEQQKRTEHGLSGQERVLNQEREKLESLEVAWHDIRHTYPSLPQDTDIATRYVRQLKQLFDWIRDMDTLKSDIDTKEVSCAAFERRADLLAERLSEHLTGFPSLESWVRHVRERLAASRTAAEQFETIKGEVTRIEALMELTQSELRECESEIQEYLLQYNCADAESLRTLVDRSIAFKKIDENRQEQERILRQTGDGLSVAELEAEFTEVDDVDVLPAKLSVLTSDIEDLQSQSEREIGELREKQIAFRVLDGTQTAAADRAQEAEAHLADVDRLWNEYLRVDLARRLLQRAIEEFREQNQSSILARASDFFQRLTVSHYNELAVEYDGTTPYLEAVHIDGSKRRVHQMSDGTRDQLFLSLRLAFVEQHLATSGPLPLIMDDILVHFDDDRTKATLQVLHELSGRTQILYFTHHQSVVDAAHGLGDDVRVHHLGMSEELHSRV